ncbi:hypothetical protein Prum_036100 [Phytohabitans rumicis]|uniref:Uncharacterized protein n=1 Tax=Phytohabitans rumicis TaxID=1076125 RepID=A0A6V8L4Q8_9ACTN|nr:hypothetical protein Prum_036100 [Phytohabitans rumicis]
MSRGADRRSDAFRQMAARPRSQGLPPSPQPEHEWEFEMDEAEQDCPGSGHRGKLEFQKGGDDW